MRRLTLEWTFRLLSEPRRLWRRYLFGNTRFVVMVIPVFVKVVEASGSYAAGSAGSRGGLIQAASGS